MSDTGAFLPPPLPLPAVEVSTPLATREIALCPGCGLPEAQWTAPYVGHVVEDGVYGCSTCADDTGCIWRNPFVGPTYTGGLIDMAIVRWNPWSDLFNLHSQMDELFSSALGREMNGQSSDVGHLPLDIRQSDEKFTIEASVPGFNPEDVEVTLDNGVLTVQGRMQEDLAHDDGGYVRRERRVSSVFRQIALPAEVRADEISAQFENGVLTITVPRVEKAQPKRIPVHAGGGGQARVINAPESKKERG